MVKMKCHCVSEILPLAFVTKAEKGSVADKVNLL